MSQKEASSPSSPTSRNVRPSTESNTVPVDVAGKCPDAAFEALAILYGLNTPKGEPRDAGLVAILRTVCRVDTLIECCGVIAIRGKIDNLVKRVTQAVNGKKIALPALMRMCDKPEGKDPWELKFAFELAKTVGWIDPPTADCDMRKALKSLRDGAGEGARQNERVFSKGGPLCVLLKTAANVRCSKRKYDDQLDVMGDRLTALSGYDKTTEDPKKIQAAIASLGTLKKQIYTRVKIASAHVQNGLAPSRQILETLTMASASDQEWAVCRGIIDALRADDGAIEKAIREICYTLSSSGVRHRKNQFVQDGARGHTASGSTIGHHAERQLGRVSRLMEEASRAMEKAVREPGTLTSREAYLARVYLRACMQTVISSFGVSALSSIRPVPSPTAEHSAIAAACMGTARNTSDLTPAWKTLLTQQARALLIGMDKSIVNRSEQAVMATLSMMSSALGPVFGYSRTAHVQKYFKCSPTLGPAGAKEFDFSPLLARMNLGPKDASDKFEADLATLSVTLPALCVANACEVLVRAHREDSTQGALCALFTCDPETIYTLLRSWPRARGEIPITEWKMLLNLRDFMKTLVQMLADEWPASRDCSMATRGGLSACVLAIQGSGTLCFDVWGPGFMCNATVAPSMPGGLCNFESLQFTGTMHGDVAPPVALGAILTSCVTSQCKTMTQVHTGTMADGTRVQCAHGTEFKRLPKSEQNDALTRAACDRTRPRAGTVVITVKRSDGPGKPVFGNLEQDEPRRLGDRRPARAIGADARWCGDRL